MSDVLTGEAQTAPSLTTLDVLRELHDRCDFFLFFGPRGPFEARFFLHTNAELVCDRAGLWWVLGDDDPIVDAQQLGARLAALGYPAPKR